MKKIAILRAQKKAQSEMTIEQFLQSVRDLWAKYMPNSVVFAQLGSPRGIYRGYVTIVPKMAKDKSEVYNKIWENDILNVVFSIDLGQDYETEDKNLPDTITMEPNHKSFMVKPKNPAYAYDSFKFGFRKTVGTPQKILQTLDKYFKTIRDELKKALGNDQITDNYKELLQEKVS